MMDAFRHGILAAERLHRTLAEGMPAIPFAD